MINVIENSLPEIGPEERLLDGIETPLFECPEAAKEIAVVHGRDEKGRDRFKRPSGVPIVKVAAEFRQPLCDRECSFRIPDELFQRRKTKIVRRKPGI